MGLRAVSCASTSLCVIVGGGREALVATDPTAGASAWRRVTIDATACPRPACGGPGGWPSILAVACPSPTRCVAVNIAGYVLTSTAPATDPGPWTAAWVDDAPRACGHVFDCAKAITSVACPTPDLCVAGDVDGDGFVSTDPTGGRPAWMKIPVTTHQGGGGDGISELACLPTSRCFAARYDRVLESSGALGGALWKPTRFGGAVGAVACPSATLCLAGGDDGTIAIGHAGPSRAQIRARLRAGLERRGAAAMRVTAPVPASVEVRWLRRGRLVARGSRTFERPGTARLRLELTHAGERLRADRARVRLNARATLTRPDRAAVTVKRVIRAAR